MNNSDLFKNERKTINLGDIIFYDCTISTSGLDYVLKSSIEKESEFKIFSNELSILGLDQGYFVLKINQNQKKIIEKIIEGLINKYSKDLGKYNPYELPKYCGRFENENQSYIILKSEKVNPNLTNEFAYHGIIVRPDLKDNQVEQTKQKTIIDISELLSGSFDDSDEYRRKGK